MLLSEVHKILEGLV